MMKMIKEYILELGSVRFSERDDEVVYIATDSNPELDSFVFRHRQELEDIFSQEYLRFCFERGEVNMGGIEPTLVCRAHNVSKTSYLAYHLDLSALPYDGQMIQQFKDVANAYSRKEAIDYKQLSSDREVQSMLAEMERIARALKLKGVKTELFDQMILSLEQPIEMIIHYSGKIEFPDLGGMQLHLNPVEKTLYFLFLKHPEGIHPDAVVGFRKEMLQLYAHASRFDEWQIAEDVIDSLCAEDKNVLYSNISRLKSKFNHLLGERLARHYIIKKEEGGHYNVNLPREMIKMASCWK